MSINSRPPTGKVPWPVVLIEGPEKSGKSWAAAVLSASAKVGRTYWLDIAEGAADEYGAIPGVRYEVIVHDGQWATIMAQVAEVKKEAERAAKVGEVPVVLVVDSASAEWEFLKDWATGRAAKTSTNRQKLQQDPNAEITVASNFWNDAAARHRRLMTMLLTFPGIVILTARGKVVLKMGDNGRPIEGQKSYSVEGHKSLAYDATVWVRLARDAAPQIIAARSVHAGIKPGKDKPRDVEDTPNLLEWVIFDFLKVEPTQTHVRDVHTLDGDKLTPDERAEIDPEGAALEARELAAVVNKVRRAAIPLNLQSTEDIAADYARRNGGTLAEASLDELRQYLTDLLDEFKAMGDATPAPPLDELRDQVAAERTGANA